MFPVFLNIPENRIKGRTSIGVTAFADLESATMLPTKNPKDDPANPMKYETK